MKRFLTIIISCAIMLALLGCALVDKSVHVNAENPDNLSNNTFGTSALVEIGDDLWYDSTTRIVYWWNGVLNCSRIDTVPSPYYAPNGLPYRYNPETNTFEEIEVTPHA